MRALHKIEDLWHGVVCCGFDLKYASFSRVSMFHTSCWHDYKPRWKKVLAQVNNSFHKVQRILLQELAKG